MPVSIGRPDETGRREERARRRPASATAAGLQRRPDRKPSRRNTQVRRNALVLAWIVVAAVLAVLIIAGPLASWGTWLPLHALLLGGIGSAITVWSAHFADTLLHRPALGGAALLDARLYAHGAGTALVLVGITASWPVVAIAGVTIIVLAALTGVVAISVQYRRAVAPRLAALAIHYAVALMLLALGAVFGYLTNWAEARGSTHLSDVFYVAHTTTMVLGFVGTTVLGTLTVLWPTMLRTKMEPEAPRWTTRGLPLLVCGTALVAASGLFSPLAVVGMIVYLAGACGVIVPGFKTARRVPPTSFATASAAAAVIWFLIGVVRIGTGIGGRRSRGHPRRARAPGCGLRPAGPRRCPELPQSCHARGRTCGHARHQRHHGPGGRLPGGRRQRLPGPGAAHRPALGGARERGRHGGRHRRLRPDRNGAERAGSRGPCPREETRGRRYDPWWFTRCGARCVVVQNAGLVRQAAAPASRERPEAGSIPAPSAPGERR